MSIQIKVPSMMCDGCVKAISSEITKNLPDATISADVDRKMITVETTASKSEIAAMIVAAGHETED